MPEPTGPNNIIAQLPLLSFKGLEAAPYDDVSFGWSHTQVKRLYAYIDGAGHDNTGRDPIGTTANMFFLNSPPEDAFPDLWNQWRDVLFEGSLGQIVHPGLG